MRTFTIKRNGMQVRSAVLCHYETVTQSQGCNPLPLLRKVGLSRRILATPTQFISVNSAVALLEESAEVSGCSTFGLLMAEARSLSDFGPVSLLLTQQPSVRSAINTIAQYRHLLNEALGMMIEDAGKMTLVREEIMTDHPRGARQSIEMAIGVLMLVVRAILGSHWRPQSVHFTHGGTENLQVYRRIFNCPIHFDADFNGVMCLTSDLDKPNAKADTAMAMYAQSFIDAIPKPGQSNIVLDVRKSVYLLLPMGRASVEQIAFGLGLNVRTLQRQLDEYELNFSSIINDVRRELAQRYIVNTEYSLGRVAEQLGYTNLSSFSRWFQAQFQCAPSEMRSRKSLRLNTAPS